MPIGIIIIRKGFSFDMNIKKIASIQNFNVISYCSLKYKFFEILLYRRTARS